MYLPEVASIINSIAFKSSTTRIAANVVVKLRQESEQLLATIFLFSTLTSLYVTNISRSNNVYPQRNESFNVPNEDRRIGEIDSSS
jgi:hypothetical protein